MMKLNRYKQILVVFSVLVGSLLLMPGGVQAATPCPTGPNVKGSSKNQVLGGLGQATNDCSGQQVGTAIAAIVTIFAWVAGILGVIMVVISGFKFIMAGGDSSKVGSARSTLMYALIGLVIAALAQFLVHFVINQTNNALNFNSGGTTLASGGRITVSWKGGIGPYTARHGNTVVCTAPAKATSCKGVVSASPPREIIVTDKNGNNISASY